MTKKIELQMLLRDIISKYIINYLDTNYSYSDNINNNYYFDKDENLSVVTTIDEFVKEVFGKPSFPITLALDGSSRSFISSKGIISLASVVVSSSINPIIGIYPPISGFPTLDLNKPFIALATSGFQGPLTSFLYSSEYITTFSIDGSFFTSTNSPEEIETEIRTVLETEALKKIVNQNSIILLDGPLIPPLIFLKSKVRNEILKFRLDVLKENVIGVVKRLDKSKLLVSALSDLKQKFINKFRINPQRYFNDESFILDFIKYNVTPPYKPLVFGPILRQIDNIKLYVNYLIYPLHPYVFKFSILRIESLKNDFEVLSHIVSLKFTKDGIPLILGLADNTAKEVTGAMLKIIMSSLESMGLQASFYSRLEQVGT
ncbi:MAG: DNA double-strand break repair nuclease NurA [Saccharolobus sp.]